MSQGLADLGVAGGISMGPTTLSSIIPSGPMSANIWFADGFGTWYGTGNGTTQPDSTLTWDDTNQWVQLAIPGAGGTGLAEMRWRGDFSRAGAADTFYLNQYLPGVLTITAGVTQTTVALHAFSAAAISNAAQTVTNLYTAYFETPSTSAGTVTYRAPIGIQYGAGGILLESQSAAATPSAIEASYYAATTLDSLHLGGPGMAGSLTAGIFIQENGWVNLRSTSLQLNLNVELGWGDQATYSAAPYTAIDWSTAQTNDGLVWGMATSNASLLMVAYANRNNDYARAAATNPELAVYSATAAATATDEWIAISHNVTDGVISVGSGNVLIGGTSSFAVAATARVYLDGGGDTYIVEGAGNQIDFYAGGANTARFTGAALYSLIGGFAAAASGGTATDPLYTFNSDFNTGMYRVAADTLGFTCGGVLNLTIGNATIGFFAAAAAAQQTITGSIALGSAVANSVADALIAYGLAIDGRIP